MDERDYVMEKMFFNGATRPVKIYKIADGCPEGEALDVHARMKAREAEQFKRDADERGRAE